MIELDLKSDTNSVTRAMIRFEIARFAAASLNSRGIMDPSQQHNPSDKGFDFQS
jgi:hypothetical protein